MKRSQAAKVIQRKYRNKTKKKEDKNKALQIIYASVKSPSIAGKLRKTSKVYTNKTRNINLNKKIVLNKLKNEVKKLKNEKKKSYKQQTKIIKKFPQSPRQLHGQLIQLWENRMLINSMLELKNKQIKMLNSSYMSNNNNYNNYNNNYNNYNNVSSCSYASSCKNSQCSTCMKYEL